MGGGYCPLSSLDQPRRSIARSCREDTWESSILTKRGLASLRTVTVVPAQTILMLVLLAGAIIGTIIVLAVGFDTFAKSRGGRKK